MYAMCFILPIILFLLFSNTYAIRLMRQQVASSDRNTIELYAKQLDTKLDSFQDYLVNIGMNRICFSQFSSATDKDEAQLRGYELQNEMKEELYLYEDVTEGVFFYQPAQDVYIRHMMYVETVAVQDAIEQTIKELIAGMQQENEVIEARWFEKTLEEESYLFRIYYYKGVYYGSWNNVPRLLKNLVNTDIEGVEKILLLNKNYEPLDNWEKWDQIETDLPSAVRQEYQTDTDGTYMVLGSRLQSGRYFLFCFIRTKDILGSLQTFRYWILIMFAVSAGLLLLFLQLTQKQFGKPLKDLSDRLNKIENGELGVRMEEEGQVRELLEVSRSFNDMVQEIQNLKIQVYEERLQKQTAKLEFLQIQTNPHFFINAMNMILNYARLNMIDEVREFTRSLIRHFRYTLYGKNWVTVKEEFDFISNYIEMQQKKDMGMHAVELDIQIEKGMEAAQIPILSIQTFVENSMKYGETEEGKTSVTIQVIKTEENRLRIRISDTGSGFGEEELERLRSGEDKWDGRKHIGVTNVRNRLKILYGENFKLCFFNDQNSGGAVTEMELELHLNDSDGICEGQK